MVFQLFFECSGIPDGMMNMQLLNIPCFFVVRGENRISVLLNYDELNAYMIELGFGSANLTHIVMGDEKDVL